MTKSDLAERDARAQAHLRDHVDLCVTIVDRCEALRSDSLTEMSLPSRWYDLTEARRALECLAYLMKAIATDSADELLCSQASYTSHPE